MKYVEPEMKVLELEAEIICTTSDGPVKIYAQNCLQAPAE